MIFITMIFEVKERDRLRSLVRSEKNCMDPVENPKVMIHL